MRGRAGSAARGERRWWLRRRNDANGGLARGKRCAVGGGRRWRRQREVFQVRIRVDLVFGVGVLVGRGLGCRAWGVCRLGRGEEEVDELVGRDVNGRYV